MSSVRSDIGKASAISGDPTTADVNDAGMVSVTDLLRGTTTCWANCTPCATTETLAGPLKPINNPTMSQTWRPQRNKPSTRGFEPPDMNSPTPYESTSPCPSLGYLTPRPSFGHWFPAVYTGKLYSCGLRPCQMVICFVIGFGAAAGGGACA